MTEKLFQSKFFGYPAYLESIGHRVKIIPIVALTATLVGCASPGQLRAGTPLLELTSLKSSKSVAVCIADKWENAPMFGSLAVNMRPTSTGNNLTIYNGDAVAFLADIDDVGSGSKTRYFEGNVIGGGDYRKAVSGCQ